MSILTRLPQGDLLRVAQELLEDMRRLGFGSSEPALASWRARTKPWP